MLDFDFIEWDDEDDPRGNVKHIADNGITSTKLKTCFTAGMAAMWSAGRAVGPPGSARPRRERRLSSSTNAARTAEI
jgi:hypothetical protein